MSSSPAVDSHALDGAIAPTFVRYLIPSLVGLIAMTSASLVDGVFIGNYVGVTALAAVNLLVPVVSLLFGVGMMLAIGGSVRAGKNLGEGDAAAASAIFSKTLISAVIYGLTAIFLGLVFERQVFLALGATEDLIPAMSEYYRVIMPFLCAQLMLVVLYFFIRLDGFPGLASAALVAGALVNFVLDYLFIGVYGWRHSQPVFVCRVQHADFWLPDGHTQALSVGVRGPVPWSGFSCGFPDTVLLSVIRLPVSGGTIYRRRPDIRPGVYHLSLSPPRKGHTSRPALSQVKWPEHGASKIQL